MEEVEFKTIHKSIQEEPAISIQNAYKRYSSKSVVLNGLNLTVPQGTIYGLLGPSGCGKTTLLNCITGITVLDSGRIELSVKRRSEVGYMPQFLSLYPQMTIIENFYVYGYLFGMFSEDIKARSKDLISFLELPDGNRFVSTLSGGQQRRVSIAVSFIHDPKILILDEPTVGLDPILSHSIWERLQGMAAEGKSIIITTHYIEEAKQAHTIGVMRNGKLLANEAPLRLIAQYGCSNLEDAFLLLSRKQEDELQNTKHLDYPKKRENVKVHYEDDRKTFSMTKLKAITYKNFTLIKREYVFLLLLLVLPITQTFFGNLSLGVKPRNLSVGVINEEISMADCKYTTFNGCILNENHNFSFSCLYLQYIKSESYQLVEYNDEATALHDVNKTKIRALLHFSKNYTSSIAQRVLYARETSNEDLITSNVDIWVDSKDYFISTIIKYDAIRNLLPVLERSMTNCELNPKSGLAMPLTFEKPIFGTTAGNFASQTAIAMLCLCCFFLPAMMSGGFLFIEKAEGIIERLMVAGATISEIIVSISIVQLIVHIVQTMEAMFVTFVWYDNPLEGSVVVLIWLLIGIGITGMFFGIMLGVSSANITITAYAGVGTNIAMVFTTGISWPVEGAHYLLRSITWALPMTMPIEAARVVSFKSYNFTNYTVLTGFASCFGWSLIFAFVLYFVTKFKGNSWAIKS